MKKFRMITVLLAIVILAIPRFGLTEEAGKEETEKKEEKVLKEKEEVKEKKTLKLEKITVTGEREEGVVKVPAVVETVTREDIEKIHVMDIQDMLKHIPSVDARKLRPGGGGPSGIRGSKIHGEARVIVLVDGAPAQSLAGRTGAGNPTLDQIGPHEVERLDVIYGPFSALYSGIAQGGVVNITTREPAKREIFFKTQYGFQDFNNYKFDEFCPWDRTHASYGDKIGRFHISADIDRFTLDGHPIRYPELSAEDGRSSGFGTPVSSYIKEKDPYGKTRYVIGDYGKTEKIHWVGKLKLGFDIDEYTKIITEWRHWDKETERKHLHTYLRDPAGNEVFSGPIMIEGKRFFLPPSHPFSCRETKAIGDTYRLSFRREPPEGIKTRLNFSFDDSWRNNSRGSSSALPEGVHGGPGTLGEKSTDWYYFDWQNSFTVFDEHSLTGGIHYDKYILDGGNYKTTEWIDEEGKNLTSRLKGKTRTCALFLEDEWKVWKDISLYLGGRYEWWKAYDGSNLGVDAQSQHHLEEYSSRSESKFSPKFGITYNSPASLEPLKDMSLRFSIARAYRFPVATELYYASIDKSTGIVTTPVAWDLKPENILSKDFTVKKKIKDTGTVARLSFFENIIKEHTFRQWDIYTDTSYTQNVGKVRTRGIELSLNQRLWSNLTLNFSATYLDARILENRRNQASEDKYLPNSPKWSFSSVLTYTPVENFTASLSGRYKSRMYTQLDNSDKGKGMGTDEEFYFIDTKLSYKFFEKWLLTLSVDNLFDDLFFHGCHCYPRRMFSFSLEWNY